MPVPGAEQRVRVEQVQLVLDADAEDGAWSAQLKQLTLGGLPSDVVRMERASASGLLEGRRPVLAKASADATTLQWAADTIDAYADGAFFVFRIGDSARHVAVLDRSEGFRSGGASAPWKARMRSRLSHNSRQLCSSLRRSPS